MNGHTAAERSRILTAHLLLEPAGSFTLTIGMRSLSVVRVTCGPNSAGERLDWGAGRAAGKPGAGRLKETSSRAQDEVPGYLVLSALHQRLGRQIDGCA
jgi:hypothetical protein